MFMTATDAIVSTSIYTYKGDERAQNLTGQQQIPRFSFKGVDPIVPLEFRGDHHLF